MALVPHRPRDFQVASPVWMTATGNKPFGRRPPLGPGIKAKQVVRGQSPRQMMLSCAQRMWLHTNSVQIASLAAGSVTPLNDLAQGSANGTRIGDQVRCVELEYCCRFSTSTAVGTSAARFVVFKDTQPNGALPTVAELLCLASAESCFNPDLVGNQALPRFVILANEYSTTNNPGPFTNTASFSSRPLVGRIRLDFTTTYVGNAGTFADLQSNGLYFLVITSDTSTAFVGDFCLKYLKM